MLTDRLASVAVVPHRLERRRSALCPLASSTITEVTSDGEQHGEHRRGQARRRSGALRSSRRAHLSLAPVMAEPSSLGRDRRRVERGRRCRPRSITSSVSDRPISSSRSAEISSTASPAARACAELVPDRGLRADVDAAGRVRGDQQPSGSPLISRPTISFCWLPPDSAEAATSIAGRAHVVLVDDPLGVAPWRPCGRSSGPRAFGALRLVAEHPVLPQRRLEQEAVPAGGPRGCSRCRPRGARGCASAVMSLAAEQRSRPARAGADAHDAPRPARPGRCPRRRRCRAISPGGSVNDDVVEQRRGRPSTHASGPRPSSSTTSVTVDSRGLGRRQLAADHQLGELVGRSPPSGATVATVRAARGSR